MNFKHTSWIVAVLLLAGCIDKAGTKAADDATAQFYKALAAKDYGGIYDAAAPQFRATAGRDLFIGMMQRVDRKLGDCQAPVKAMDWHMNTTPSGTFLAQGYTQACANGQLTETLTVVVNSGKAQVIGFNANSPLLLTD
jgi:hypothetical protein